MKDDQHMKTMREAFEKWCIKNGILQLSKSDVVGGYIADSTEIRWETWQAARQVKHVGQCATDPIAEQVCNDIYQQRTDDNLGLCEALRAIYALCGEDEQITKIIDDALRDYGVGEA